MNSTSRASFSSRLTEGEKLIEYLNTFTNYTPGDAALTAAAFQTQITALHALQDEHTAKHFAYSNAAFQRRGFFDTNEVSISKLLSPIGANVRGRLGKNSQQYHDINALVLKIRGQKRISVSVNSKEETISHCENSFGSRLIYFGDIITLLTGFGTDYSPANNNITISSMQDLLHEATNATAVVSQKLALFKPLIGARQNGFKQLSTTATRIKDVVLSQYGLESPEYLLIKSLKI